MIAYATQPDAVALDGDGRNSPFTTALLKHVRTPGLDISVVMRRIRADVVTATRSKQVPWDHSSLIGDVVLVPASLTTAPPAQAPRSNTSAADRGPPRTGSAAVLHSRPARRSRPAPRRHRRSVRRGSGCRVRTAPAAPPMPAAICIARVRSWIRNSATSMACAICSAAIPAPPGWKAVPALASANRSRSNSTAIGVVRSLQIQNGYQKNQDIYQKNGRVRRLRAVFSNGETMSFPLQDRQGAQTITLDRPVRAYWVQLIIDEIYPGNRYTDTAISKLLVMSERAPVTRCTV